MLPLLVALLVAVGPLLRGAWDLWAQTFLFIGISAGTGLWLAGRILAGYVPLPSSRTLWWAGSLAILGWLSAALSPVAAYAGISWRVWVAALWLFVVISAVSKDQRSLIDEMIRVCGWVLLLLAFYQQYEQGMHRPTASLVNQNVFAGTLLLILPLCVQKRDWPLAAGLAWALVLTRSAGAWLGLSAALVLMRRHSGRIGYWFGLGVGLCCAVAIYGKFQTPEVLNRWNWWLDAVSMSRESPWLGLGPGSFAHVLPAYHATGELSTLYAHQHLLEIAAELGLPFLFLWLAGMSHCLRLGGPHKIFGVVAILVQSLWDYSLSIPANLWLFSYYLASSVSESARGFNVASRYKLPACLLVLGLGSGITSFLWNDWQADRLRASVLELLPTQASLQELLRPLEESLLRAEHPEARRLAAEVELRAAAGFPGARPDGRAILAAAAHLERSAMSNPYRASTWLILVRLYRQLGFDDLARAKREEGAAFCPSLR